MRHALSPLLAMLLCAAAPPISFTPADPRLASAADDYRRLWESDGPRIVAALETETGLRFPAAPIEAFVAEARPMTSYDGRTMRLRAARSPSYEKATLVHELGHRLAFTLGRTNGLDDHRLLDLFLYDALTDLYGREFAERVVAMDRRLPGRPEYGAAWNWALSMTKAERQARLAALRQAAR